MVPFLSTAHSSCFFLHVCNLPDSCDSVLLPPSIRSLVVLPILPFLTQLIFFLLMRATHVHNVQDYSTAPQLTCNFLNRTLALGGLPAQDCSSHSKYLTKYDARHAEQVIDIREECKEYKCKKCKALLKKKGGQREHPVSLFLLKGTRYLFGHYFGVSHIYSRMLELIVPVCGWPGGRGGSPSFLT